MNKKLESNHYLVNDAILKDIRDVLRGVHYGNIEIKVHNSRVVQIDVTHRQRFDEVWTLEGGGGI
ncbi:MAG: YezD family protein [Candidatus Omnitrophica bacterium]|nr:YezD family protein [Candidatus Omnitrophota bacterium]